ncbi:MAG: hypothetical protein AAGJ08_12815 [Cyanobacteria bacterium P01_H01_bin.35]
MSATAETPSHPNGLLRKRPLFHPLKRGGFEPYFLVNDDSYTGDSIAHNSAENRPYHQNITTQIGLL